MKIVLRVRGDPDDRHKDVLPLRCSQLQAGHQKVADRHYNGDRNMIYDLLYIVSTLYNQTP